MPAVNLSQSTFKLWKKKKTELGYGNKAHSAFAHYLLERSIEIDSSSSESETDEEILAESITNGETDCSVDVTGTTGEQCASVDSVAESVTTVQPCNEEAVDMMAMVDDVDQFHNITVQSTSNQELNTTPQIATGSRLPLTASTINSLLNSTSTPMGKKNLSLLTADSERTMTALNLSTEGDRTITASNVSCDDGELSDSFYENITDSENETTESEEESSSESSDEEDSDTEDLEHLVHVEDDECEDVDFNMSLIQDRLIIDDDETNSEASSDEETDADTSFEDDPNCTQIRCEDMSISILSGSDAIELPLQSNLDDFKRKLSTAYDGLCEIKTRESDLVDRERVIVSMEMLLELKGDKCGECNGKLKFEWRRRGAVKTLKWFCPSGHTGRWSSSEIITTRHTSPVYLNNILVTSSVVCTGNNWLKFHHLCQSLNLVIPSKSQFFKNQTFFVSAEIRSFWEDMIAESKKIMAMYCDIRLSGDGRSDSPGHCAQFCTYVLMEQFSKVIVDLEVLDSRETEGVSTRMEKEGLIRLLKKLKGQLDLVEITTDASTTIIKALKDLKNSDPDGYKKLFHSLDVWHKSKSIRKSLSKICKAKENEEIVQWVEPIINHFWYCAQMCNGDVERLKDTWIGVVHHVCGEHEWAEGKCLHGQLDEVDKTPLSKSSKAMEVLRNAVLDKKLMDSFQFYTRFRHTGDLESFNSMLLKYAPKRMSFDYYYYTDRMYLAGIDHNIHLFRKKLQSKKGNQIYARKYNKRSRKFSAQPLKVPKTYPHLRVILSKIVKRRTEHREAISRTVTPERPRDPKLIAPTLGGQPPRTADLVTQHVSRLQKKL